MAPRNPNNITRILLCLHSDDKPCISSHNNYFYLPVNVKYCMCIKKDVTHCVSLSSVEVLNETYVNLLLAHYVPCISFHSTPSCRANACMDELVQHNCPVFPTRSYKCTSNCHHSARTSPPPSPITPFTLTPQRGMEG